jgi:hypothetical protein
MELVGDVGQVESHFGLFGDSVQNNFHFGRFRHDPRHLGVASGASKTISKPMVRSAQTVHLSFVNISTISKQTKTSFHLSLVT